MINIESLEGNSARTNPELHRIIEYKNIGDLIRAKAELVTNNINRNENYKNLDLFSQYKKLHSLRLSNGSVTNDSRLVLLQLLTSMKTCAGVETAQGKLCINFVSAGISKNIQSGGTIPWETRLGREENNFEFSGIDKPIHRFEIVEYIRTYNKITWNFGSSFRVLENIYISTCPIFEGAHG
ncbi:unnamed protein product [Lepeophtheirus salmonis]|uniref:(salmon louse) hypothetical protein n=1 Tax=Lepeophtheirus salmonis TaxID=72036 RepID=A0A7R8HBQ1_LEPSM|nr:unnamed protein product [Lepeophtheirus salmonis]CAF2991419.1 unnamed protein product [Lepeophtheirus salmonis]